MHSIEPNDVELSLFNKILMKKIIFQYEIATDPMGKRSSEREGIHMLFPENMKFTMHDNSRGAKTRIMV